jgi:alpha-L-fucosidase
MQIYLGSVGRNCNLLLNIGVDRRGLVNENDIERLMEFKAAREKAFGVNLAKGTITASNTRGRGRRFAAANVLDGSFETYWATDNGVTSASITLDLGRDTEFDTVLLQENIALGQRVKRFSIEVWNDSAFQPVAQQTTIGYKRIVRFSKTRTSKVRVVIEDAKACPTVSTLELYNSGK